MILLVCDAMLCGKNVSCLGGKCFLQLLFSQEMKKECSVSVYPEDLSVRRCDWLSVELLIQWYSGTSQDTCILTSRTVRTSDFASVWLIPTLYAVHQVSRFYLPHQIMQTVKELNKSYPGVN